MMVVPVETAPNFIAGEPTLLFERPYYLFASRRTYDVSPDGRRFLMVKEGAVRPDADVQGPRINVVLNWSEELKARVPLP